MRLLLKVVLTVCVTLTITVSSPRVSASDAEVEYEAIRQVAIQKLKGRTFADIYGRYVDGACSAGTDAIEVADIEDSAGNINDIILIELLTREAKRRGILPAAEPYLGQLRHSVLRRIATGSKYNGEERWVFFEHLKDSLNNAVGSSYYETTECGGGEIGVVLSWTPSSARAAIIHEFRFDVCRARGFDPWDLERCFGWRLARHKEAEELAGSYHYVLVRSGGVASTGRFVISRQQLEYEMEHEDTEDGLIHVELK
jgi:hypothetical protein